MANIFAQYAQPVRSIQDYQADEDNRSLRREQLAGAQRQNALAELMANQQRQTMADSQRRQNALRQAAEGSRGLPPEKYAETLLSNPDTMDAGVTLQKHLTDTGKVASATDKERTETAEVKRKALLQQVAALQSPQDALALIDHGVQAQSLPEPIAAGLRNMIRTDPRWQLNLMLGIGDPSKMLDVLKPHLQTVNAGNAQVQQAVDPRTGQVIETGRTPILQSPDNAATVGASIENNKRTVGASLANASAVRAAAETTARGNVDAAKAKRDQDTEMKLADDYRAQSKEFGKAKSAYQQLTATLDSATTSPAATLAAATKFMKVLDPESVVRESELGMALAASGVIDRAMNYVSTLQSGKKLTPTQAKDFKNISGKMFAAAQQVQQAVDTDYKAKAKTYGLRPEMVVQELGQNAKEVNFGDLK